MSDLDKAKNLIKGLLDAIEYARECGSLDYEPDGDSKDDDRKWRWPQRDAKRFVGIPTPWEDKEEEEERQRAARKAAKAAKKQRDQEALAREFGMVK